MAWQSLALRSAFSRSGCLIRQRESGRDARMPGGQRPFGGRSAVDLHRKWPRPIGMPAMGDPRPQCPVAKDLAGRLSSHHQKNLSLLILFSWRIYPRRSLSPRAQPALIFSELAALNYGNRTQPGRLSAFGDLRCPSRTRGDVVEDSSSLSSSPLWIMSYLNAGRVRKISTHPQLAARIALKSLSSDT